MFTLMDVIIRCGFNDFKVIAGNEGLNNEVSSVTVLDAPDALSWAKGGEFFITTGYCFKDDSKLFEELVIKGKEKGISGIGIKIDRYLHNIPQNVIDKANELFIPIIHIPNHYAFIDVINPVLINIINDQAEKLKKSEMIHRAFTQLVIDGGNLSDILNTLYRITGLESAYVDLYFDSIDVESNDTEFIEILENNKFKDSDRVKHYEISNNKVYGYLVINSKGELSELEESAIEHTSTVIKLYIQRKISNAQIEMRYRDEFVRDIIMKNIKSIEEVRKRAKIFGWNFDKKIIVVIFDIDNYKSQYLKMNYNNDNLNLEETRDKIIRIIKGYIRNEFEQSVFMLLSDSITFVLDVNDTSKIKGKITRLCQEVGNRVKEETGFTLTIAVGNVKDGIMEAKESYNEAFRVIKIKRLINKTDSIGFYDDIGVYKLYYNVSVTEDGREFCKENLNSLMEYDKKNNTNFFETLNHIINNQWNLKETAKEMFVHYNTVKYRYNKLSEIMNVDLNDFEQRLKYTVAIRVYNILSQ